MSDEIRELRNEIIALKEINGKLEGKINKLMEKIDKLKEETESLKTEKAQQNPIHSTIAIATSYPTKRTQEDESSEFGSNYKRQKLIAKIFIPNWLIEVLEWIDRKEMAISSLSTSSKTFRQLCWPKLHKNVKAHKTPRLELFPVQCEFGNFRTLIRLDWGKEIIPLASIPPPDYITSIGSIEIKFLDDQVVNFIKNIAHMLQNCTFCFYKMSSQKLEKKMVTSFHALLECLADKKFKFVFAFYKLKAFNGLFPGILEKVYFLHFWMCGLTGDDDDIDFILNWLTNQSNNGKQKIIKFACSYFGICITSLISRIKKEFFNSNFCSIFFICFYPDESYIRLENVEEFTLENKRSNEILAFYRVDRSFYLARYPKDEENWKEDGEKKIVHQSKQDSFISINIDI